MTDRAWWWLLAAITVGVVRFAILVDAQPRAVTLAVGTFGGTDVEIEGCYFSIGSGAALLLRPMGEPCVLARELVGRTGTLIFAPD